MQTAKGNILKRIREALTQTTPVPFPGSEGQSSVFVLLSQDIDVEFAERFTELKGKFAFCFDQKDLLQQFKALIAEQRWTSVYCMDTRLQGMLELENIYKDLSTCDVAVTGCEYLVARTGSIVMSAAEQSGRSTSVYAPVHICIAYTSQLVYDIKDALEGVKEKYGKQLPSLITFATGPSRTADIEKTLVVGVHGPKEVFVFLVDDQY
ncbi:MAG: lactate utilization protein [Niabella sp.]